VKDHTISLKKGERTNHLGHIIGLIKSKSRTYGDLFLALDSDKTWMGSSKQPLKTLLSGTLSALRKNGAIKDCAPPKEQILDGLKAATTETAAARAERINARIAARKAANKERYNKLKLDAHLREMKVDQQAAEIQELKNKLAISENYANAAIQRADNAEAQVAELGEALNAYHKANDDWYNHSSQLEETIKRQKALSSAYNLFFLFNILCALIGAHYLGTVFPSAYAAAADNTIANYRLAIRAAPILYQRTLERISSSAENMIDLAAASTRPVFDYAMTSAKPIFNYLQNI
jgi:hypothetical protein